MGKKLIEIKNDVAESYGYDHFEEVLRDYKKGNLSWDEYYEFIHECFENIQKELINKLSDKIDDTNYLAKKQIIDLIKSDNNIIK